MTAHDTAWLPDHDHAGQIPDDIDDPDRYVRCAWCPTMIPSHPTSPKHRRLLGPGGGWLCRDCTELSRDLEAEQDHALGAPWEKNQ